MKKTEAAILLATGLAFLRGAFFMVKAVSRDPDVVEMSVSSAAEVEDLVDALQCDGPGQFVVDWQGEIVLSRTVSVSNGSTLNVTGSSSATIDGGGAVRLFEVDNNSTIFLEGIKLSRGSALGGGGGALYVAGNSEAEVVNCSFIDNNASSSGGKDKYLD